MVDNAIDPKAIERIETNTKMASLLCDISLHDLALLIENAQNEMHIIASDDIIDFWSDFDSQIISQDDCNKLQAILNKLTHNELTFLDSMLQVLTTK